MRSVNKIIPAQKINMDGHIIDQALPNQFMAQLDPFLLIHHIKWELEGNQRPQDLGVASHPHRGFSPVTYVIKGDLRHQDSFGNDVIVKEGGTQWMHAGKGITHSERPSAELAHRGGTQELLQFWVNSPARHKMEMASYLPLSKEDTPIYHKDNYSLQVVAGTVNQIKGPVSTFSPMLLLRGDIQYGKMTIDVPINYNTLIYLLDGELVVDEHLAQKKDLVWFKNDASAISLSANEPTRFVVFAGEPIGEEVTRNGPYVMNTQTEILEAMRDANMGKMGILIENFDK